MLAAESFQFEQPAAVLAQCNESFVTVLTYTGAVTDVKALQLAAQWQHSCYATVRHLHAGP